MVIHSTPAYSANSVYIQDGFVSAHECDELFNWTIENAHEPWFMPIDNGRVSTRPYRGNIVYPPVAYAIQARIIGLLGLHGVQKAPFVDGIYSGLARNSREYAYRRHVDPIYVDGTYTLHCNVVVTESPGGDVLIDNIGIVEMVKGRLIVLPVSEIRHGVTCAKSDAPRNLWVFGFCVPIHKNGT